MPYAPQAAAKFTSRGRRLAPEHDLRQCAFALVEGLPPPGCRLILLVEDDAPLRRTLRDWLQQKGWQVVDAAGLHDGVCEWQQHREQLSLVIADFFLAESVTGKQLVDPFQMDRHEVPCLLISGAWPPGQAPADEPGRQRFYRAKLDLSPDFLRLVKEILDHSVLVQRASEAGPRLAGATRAGR